LAVLAFLAGTPAQALNTHSFISNTGNDASSCLNAPNACGSIAGALAKTNAGGEISIINTGDYGVAAITKAINITNDGGGEASLIVGVGGVGLNIFAGAGDVVSLRGLVLDGQGVGNFGIFVASGSAVHIQNGVIRNFEGAGSGYGIIMKSPSPT